MQLTLADPSQTLIYASLIGIAAGACGPMLTKIAAKRSVHQVIPQDTQSEDLLLGYLYAHPQTIVEMESFILEDFTLEDNQKAWAEIEAALRGNMLPNAWVKVKGEKEPAAPESDSLNPENYKEISLLLETSMNPETLARWAETSLGKTLKDARHAGGTILADGMERRTFIGNSPLIETPDGIRREYAPPNRTRMWLGAGWMLLVGILAVLTGSMLLESGTPVVSVILGGMAMLALGAASLIWALVDSDTLFLDLPSFLIGVSVSTLLAVASALSASDPWRLVAAGACVAGIILLFVVVNVIYARLRGMSGMGGGDSLIAIGTVGVPVALIGDPILAYWILMASFVTALLGFVLKTMKHRRAGWRIPFAFGPYMALGWATGLIIWMLT